ncbi:alpha/beta hydrolase [Streptomyces capparidis]
MKAITATPGRVTAAAAAGLAVLAASLSVPAGASAAQAGGAGPGPARFHDQRLEWGGCATGPDDEQGRELERAGARCAELTVPLDHARPHGRTITVAVSRIAAADPARRVGALLVNTGGPGGQGIFDPPFVRKAMKRMGERWDVIGMDPRFVGRSTPLDCGWPTGTAVRSAGPDRATYLRAAAFARDLADRCARAHGDVLPYASTRDTARDIDVLRAALGERKLSYLGYSYGTYLGTAYTQMFPGRTDRVVLDGAIDPGAYRTRLLFGAEGENERALAAWASWAARRHADFGLGATREAVLRTVDGIARAAAERPLRVGAFRVDATEVPALLVNGTADDRDPARAEFASAVAVLHRAARDGHAEPTASFAETLAFFLTGVHSSYGSAQTAILCADVAEPRDTEVQWRDVERVRARHPLFGPLTRNVTPCAFWPTAPREEPVRVHRDTPALIVAATGDARTAYTGSAALRRQLPSSRLVTLRGAYTHGVYGEYGNACVDGHVNAYLATGRLPAGDRTCAR